MKVKGYIRKLDILGRLTLPSEFRKTLDMKKRQECEMILVEEGILVKIPNNPIKRLKDYTTEELIEEINNRK